MRSGYSILAVPVLALGMATVPAQGSTLDGIWRSPDGKNGGYLTVRVHPCRDDPDERCATVTGAHRGAKQQAVGRQVMRDMERSADGTWKGRIIQPLKGEVYRGRIRPVSRDVMQVDGCIIGGVLCRSQQWTRLD